LSHILPTKVKTTFTSYYNERKKGMVIGKKEIDDG
jgi:hypothetical protein